MVHDGPVRGLVVGLAVAVTSCGSSVRLHAPEVAESLARDGAARVDVEPFETRQDMTARIQSGESIDAHPEPAAVVTAGLRSEIAGRALHGGEPGGSLVKCTL